MVDVFGMELLSVPTTGALPCCGPDAEEKSPELLLPLSRLPSSSLFELATEAGFSGDGTAGEYRESEAAWRSGGEEGRCNESVFMLVLSNGVCGGLCDGASRAISLAASRSD